MILTPKEGESADTPKKFTNIDNEIFVCTWDNIPHSVNPGETVYKPLYLVNYMAMHLARKMLKREAYKNLSENERKGGIVRWRNEEKEKELQIKMTQQEAPSIKSEIASEDKKEEFVCETCSFKSASRIGSIAHSKKHK
jgi:hypothetical protein